MCAQRYEGESVNTHGIVTNNDLVHCRLGQHCGSPTGTEVVIKLLPQPLMEYSSV